MHRCLPWLIVSVLIDLLGLCRILVDAALFAIQPVQHLNVNGSIMSCMEPLEGVQGTCSPLRYACMLFMLTLSLIVVVCRSAKAAAPSLGFSESVYLFAALR